MGSILVTGGTGTLGRAVVQRLRDNGHDVRVASRRLRPAHELPQAWVTVDYHDKQLLERALGGVDAVVHCAWSLRGGVDRVLIAAANRARVPHLVYISVVGVDRLPFVYYRAKFESERRIERSGVPFTILRATQFHSLLAAAFGTFGRLPVIPVLAETKMQPIDVREVGARLAEAAATTPAGHVPDLGGPEVREFGDLARAYLRHTGMRRIVWPIRLPGGTARALRNGWHLARDNAVGRITFEESLEERAGTLGPAANHLRSGDAASPEPRQ